MPMYEFYCSNCDEHFDEIVDAPIPQHPCPKCGAMSDRRFSAPAVHFKGQGWPDKEAKQKKADTIIDGKSKIKELYDGKMQDKFNEKNRK